MIKIAKAILNTSRYVLLKLWIQPFENVLRVMSVDRTPSRRLLTKGVACLKDLGWLLMTLGRVNVRRLDGADWSVTYINEDYTHSEKELCHVLFPEPPRVSQVDRVWIWRIPRMMLEFMAQTDLVVCEFNRHIRWRPREAKYFFRSPPWVRMELTVNSSLSEIMAQMSRGRRRSLAAMQEQGFTYEFSREPADLELFYYKMYVPYISSCHRERSRIEPFEAKEVMFRRGGLLMVKYRNQPVGAVLGRTIGNAFIAGSLGVHEKHFDLIKKGLVLALYGYSIEWARQNDLQYVDFGMTRARLHDSVFWAKLLWGMQVRSNILDDHTCWIFAAKNLPVSLRQFLNQAGFIAEVDGDYRCVIFGDGDFRPTNGELVRTENIVQRAGLQGLLILPEGR